MGLIDEVLSENSLVDEVMSEGGSLIDDVLSEQQPKTARQIIQQEPEPVQMPTASPVAAVKPQPPSRGGSGFLPMGAANQDPYGFISAAESSRMGKQTLLKETESSRMGKPEYKESGAMSGQDKIDLLSKEGNFVINTLQSTQSGLLDLAGTLLAFPETVAINYYDLATPNFYKKGTKEYEAFEEAKSQDFKRFAEPDIFTKSAKDLRKTAEEISNHTVFDRGIWESFQQKDFAGGGEQLAYAVAANIPQFIGMGLSLFAGVPSAGLAVLGASAAGGKYLDLEESGLSPEERARRGAMAGIIEIFAERAGTVGLWQKILSSSVARNLFKNGFARGIYNLSAILAREPSEELGTQIANNFVDSIFGITHPDGSPIGLFDGAADAALIATPFAVGSAGVIGARALKTKRMFGPIDEADIERTARILAFDTEKIDAEPVPDIYSPEVLEGEELQKRTADEFDREPGEGDSVRVAVVPEGKKKARHFNATILEYSKEADQYKVKINKYFGSEAGKLYDVGQEVWIPKKDLESISVTPQQRAGRVARVERQGLTPEQSARQRQRSKEFTDLAYDYSQSEQVESAGTGMAAGIAVTEGRKRALEEWGQRIGVPEVATSERARAENLDKLRTEIFGSERAAEQTEVEVEFDTEKMERETTEATLRGNIKGFRPDIEAMAKEANIKPEGLSDDALIDKLVSEMYKEEAPASEPKQKSKLAGDVPAGGLPRPRLPEIIGEPASKYTIDVEGVPDIEAEYSFPLSGITESLLGRIKNARDKFARTFVKYVKLNKNTANIFRQLENSEEVRSKEVADLLKKSSGNMTREEADQLRKYLEDPDNNKYPERLSDFARWADEWRKKVLADYQQWGLLEEGFPEGRINYNLREIASLEEKLKGFEKKNAESKKMESRIDTLKKENELLSRLKYIPHIYKDSIRKKLSSLIKTKKGLSRLIAKAPKGRKIITIADAEKMGLTPYKDVRLLLADMIEAHQRNEAIYNAIELLKNDTDYMHKVTKEDPGPDDWVDVPIKQLKGYKVHPLLEEAMKEYALGETPPWNLYDKINAVGKTLKFYNPVIVARNNLGQSFMLGSVAAPYKPRFWKAWKEVTGDTDFLRTLSRLGLFSSGVPNVTSARALVEDYINQAEKTFGKRFGRVIKKALPNNVYKDINKITWFLDRVQRVHSVMYLHDKHGMSYEEAVRMSSLFHGAYGDIPKNTKRWMGRVLLTPSYRTSMIRLYSQMIKSTVTTQGMRDFLKSNDVIFDNLTPKEAQIFRRALFRKFALTGLALPAKAVLPSSSIARNIAKYSLYGILASFMMGYEPEELYRWVKEGKKPGTEDVLVFGGPEYEIEKIFGRSILSNLAMNLAAIPGIAYGIASNIDWKGDKVYDEGAPKGEQRLQALRWGTKEFFSPIEQTEELLEESQTPKMKKLMQFLSIYFYTRKAKADPAWKYKFKIDKVEEEFNSVLRDPSKTDSEVREQLQKSIRYITQHIADMEEELKVREPKNVLDELERGEMLREQQAKLFRFKLREKTLESERIKKEIPYRIKRRVSSE